MASGEGTKRRGAGKNGCERGANGQYLKKAVKKQAAESEGEAGGGDKEYGAPAKTYRAALPAIAGALSERAKKGSYLHARALKEIVESEALKKGTRGRKEKGFAQLLLEKIREMEGSAEHGGHGVRTESTE